MAQAVEKLKFCFRQSFAFAFLSFCVIRKILRKCVNKTRISALHKCARSRDFNRKRKCLGAEKRQQSEACSVHDEDVVLIRKWHEVPTPLCAPLCIRARIRIFRQLFDIAWLPLTQKFSCMRLMASRCFLLLKFRDENIKSRLAGVIYRHPARQGKKGFGAWVRGEKRDMNCCRWLFYCSTENR